MLTAHNPQLVDDIYDRYYSDWQCEDAELLSILLVKSAKYDIGDPRIIRILTTFKTTRFSNTKRKKLRDVLEKDKEIHDRLIAAYCKEYPFLRD
jgi:hypothetical protein